MMPALQRRLGRALLYRRDDGPLQGRDAYHANLVVNALNGMAGIGFTADTAYIHSGQPSG
jgi:hypothetical protein